MLDNLQGPVIVQGGTGVGTLTADDSGNSLFGGRTYNLENDNLTSDDLPGLSISYTNIANVVLTTAGAGGPVTTNTIHVAGSVATSSLTIDGTSANDNLQVIFASGNPIPPQGLTFDGGGSANSLTLSGNPFVNATYNASGPASGSITLDDGLQLFSPIETISYTNVQTINDISVRPFMFFPTNYLPNYLTFNATSGADVINVVDGPVLNGLASTQINGSLATLNFTNRKYLTVNTVGGNDQVELNNPDPAAALAGLTVNASAASLQAFVNVDTTAPGMLTTVKPNSLFDVVTLSPTGQNLQTLQGAVTVMGTGALILDDQNNVFALPYTLDGGSVSRQYVASIGYSGLHEITLKGGRGLGRSYAIRNTAAGATTTVNTVNGDDVINVEATTGELFVDIANSGNPTVNVSPTAQNVDTIQGAVSVHVPSAGLGQTSGTLFVNDQATTAGRSYTLAANTLTWGSPAVVSFYQVGSVILNGTAYNDTVTVQSVPANPVTLHGGGGSNNTLIGPNTSNTWLLAQPNGAEGTLDTSIVFDSFGSLIGGQSLDRFVVPDGAYIPEFLSGGDGLHGGANNTLDLSAYTTPLAEHIFSSVYGGSVAGVVRSFALCQNVIGGQSDDYFTFDQGFGLTGVDGGPGNNTLDFSPYYLSPSFLTPPAWVFEILGHNSGLVPGVIGAYSNIQNLIGTQVDDRFAFRGTAYLDGTIKGQGGNNSLEYTQSAASVSVNLQTDKASYVNFQGGSAPQPVGIFNIQKFVGGPGAANTLTAANAAANTWNITGPNNGSITGVFNGSVTTFTFTGFQNLTGGTFADTFTFQPGGGIAGTLDGAGGTNALDYSHYTGNITVDLALNLASLTGTALHIANVTGSIGSDLLVGDANANNLIGGTGRNVVIGGAGADTLDASRSAGDNLLIGGTTNYDTSLADLDSIFAEWTRTDLGFHDRYSDLTTGSNGTGAPALNSVLLTAATDPASSNGTVHADTSPDSLIGTNQIDPATGRRAHNWFFYDSDDSISNYLPSSDHETRVK
jgi:hypothetical protein